jgi:hypothetical protein
MPIGPFAASAPRRLRLGRAPVPDGNAISCGPVDQALLTAALGESLPQEGDAVSGSTLRRKHLRYLRVLALR